MRAPWALRIYAASVVVPFAIGMVAGDLGDTFVELAAVALIAGLLWLLLRGSRFAWVVLVVLEVSTLATAPFDPPAWWAVALSVLALVCLLAPSSRRYVWR